MISSQCYQIVIYSFIDIIKLRKDEEGDTDPEL